jgi:hypothetical protein
MRQVGDLIGAEGTAAAGVLGPAEHPWLKEGAIDDQLPATLEQVEQANLALGPSNSYAFSMAVHGILRRSVARASRLRVKSFSFTSICWRAASQASGDTIGGVRMAGRSPFRSFSSVLVVVMAVSELDGSGIRSG